MSARLHGARPAAVAIAAVLFAACGLAAGCGSEPESVRELLQDVRSMNPEEGGAAIERFIARRGGTPIIEGQTHVVFLVQDQDGQTPRIVGDFNDTPEKQAFFTNLHALKRVGRPEEVARSVLYLASDDSSFVTGTASLIDGGFAVMRT